LIDGYREVRKKYGVELVKENEEITNHHRITTNALKLYSRGEIIFTWIAFFFVTMLGLLAIRGKVEAWAGYLMMFMIFFSLTIQSHAVLKQKIILMLDLQQRAKVMLNELKEMALRAGVDVDAEDKEN